MATGVSRRFAAPVEAQGVEARRPDVADLRKVRRNLLDLRMTGNFLRQYPQLAVKVAAALEKVKGKKG